MGGKRKQNTPEPKCINCDGVIPQKRVEALIMLGVDQRQWTHVQCSTEKKKLGMYTGLPGVSELLIVDKIYNDTVRGMFSKAEEPESEEEDEEKSN